MHILASHIHKTHNMNDVTNVCVCVCVSVNVCVCVCVRMRVSGERAEKNREVERERCVCVCQCVCACVDVCVCLCLRYGWECLCVGGIILSVYKNEKRQRKYKFTSRYVFDKPDMLKIRRKQPKSSELGYI